MRHSAPRLKILTVLALSALVPGCATTPENTTGPQACVIVDNSEGGGTQSRIFLVATMTGWRLGMGEVGMGRTLEFCTRRVTAPERVRIIIERPSTIGRSFGNRQLVSPEFHLRSDEVWTWDLSLNRMSRSIIIR